MASSAFEPLDPIERSQEILFGLIMVLTFTGTISVTQADRVQIRDVLVAVLGCNFAWGLVDAVMHLMATFAERAREAVTAAAGRDAVPIQPASLGADDFRRAAMVFLLVFLCTVPVALPFVIVHDVRLAVRITHGLVIVMLFAAGRSLGAHAGRPPWRTGLVMALTGLVLATITIALGG